MNGTGNDSGASGGRGMNFESVVSVVIPLLYGCIVLLGTLGNLMVLLVVAVNSQMRNSTNCLVANLAFSNLLFLIFCVPFTASQYAAKQWLFADWWCNVRPPSSPLPGHGRGLKAMVYSQYLSLYASVWTLVLLALDRFLAVVFPISQLVKKAEFHTRGVRTFYFTFNIVGFILPLIVISLFYSALTVKFARMRSPGEETGRKVSSARGSTRRRITIMSAAVIATFALCWLPIHLTQALLALSYPRAFSSSNYFIAFTMLGQVMAYSNGCLNPFLYGFFSDNYRKGFYKIFQALCILIHFKRGEAYFAVRANPRLMELYRVNGGTEDPLVLSNANTRGSLSFGERIRNSAKRMSVSVVGERGIRGRLSRNRSQRRPSVLAMATRSGMLALLQLGRIEMSQSSDEEGETRAEGDRMLPPSTTPLPTPSDPQALSPL